jgi:hypothetical protein
MKRELLQSHYSLIFYNDKGSNCVLGTVLVHDTSHQGSLNKYAH